MTRWERILENASDQESWLIPRMLSRQTVQVYRGDALIEDFVLACEVRIMKRFAEMGVPLMVPQDLPELNHVPRHRLLSIWDI